MGLLAFAAHRFWPQIAAAIGIDAGGGGRPSFSLTTLDGVAVSDESLRGRVVLVNVWATWCPPCRVEMPGFQDVYDRHRARGFTIVGISTDVRGPEHVTRFLREHAITYPVAMARGAALREFGDVGLLPTSFLLDREGRIRHTVRGYFSETALDRAVARL
ncbi:MAG TPA: TlpA disulfide reductase family protein, partial [Gemmatimonadaceae bacterium]|nr:TlpA disulfide reductase family protein [Gemmatimonadaceae bacterium]